MAVLAAFRAATLQRVSLLKLNKSHWTPLLCQWVDDRIRAIALESKGYRLGDSETVQSERKVRWLPVGLSSGVASTHPRLLEFRTQRLAPSSQISVKVCKAEEGLVCP